MSPGGAGANTTKERLRGRVGSLLEPGVPSVRPTGRCERQVGHGWCTASTGIHIACDGETRLNQRTHCLRLSKEQADE